MIQIRTVLCPIGFDDLDLKEVALAVEVCRSFGARLVLHHNLGGAPPGASMSWMWQQSHPNGRSTEERAAEALRRLLAALPEDVRAEAHISAGVAGPAILEMVRHVDADLVVMATHGGSTVDHASVAELIVEQSSCPVLVLRNGCPGLSLQPAGEAPFKALVATDFTPSSERAMRYAFELARALPMRLRLLHVLPAESDVIAAMDPAVGTPVRGESPVELTHQRLKARVPEDLEDRVTVRVEIGDPAEKIAEVAERVGASCLFMGAHARGFLRRIFTRDTSLALLHKAPCPVWFVPEVRAA
jgi:nucleotide-binding universal stress UspA family protein